MTDSFVISRVFAASRERMWDAWTVPEQFAAWFGPKGVTTEVLHFDLRPGGFLHSKVTGPDGAVSWAKSTYDAIDPQSRIVWRQGWANAEGAIIPSPFPMPWALLMRTEVDFADADGGTKVTVTWTPVDPTAEELTTFQGMFASMTGGWTGSFDVLDAFLAS